MLKRIEIQSKTLLITLLSVLLLGLVGCTANHHSDGKTIQNISADFRVGGFFGTSYYVKIKDNVLSYRTYSRGITSEWQKQTLSADDIKSLENKLIELGVANWDKQYRDSRIMDGTQWAVHFSSKKIKVKSKGSNKYPDTYKALIRYISKVLLKGKSYG